MSLKDTLKKNIKSGAKLAGKTLIKSAFDIKTYVIIGALAVAGAYSNKLVETVKEEQKLDKKAAEFIERKEHDETVAAEKLENTTATEATVVRTASDHKNSWRSRLPFANKLTAKGTRDGLGLENDRQVDITLDAYDKAKDAAVMNKLRNGGR